MSMFATHDSALFEQFQERKHIESDLLRQYLPLVHKLVNQLHSHAGPIMGREDMIQLGLMALLDALRRYPGQLDAGFISYCKQKIRGSILDELRRLDWRSRGARQEAHRLNDATRLLTQQLGRSPKPDELAAEMGITLDELRTLEQESHANALQSLETLLEQGEHCHPAGSDTTEPMERQRWLAQALGQLPEPDRLVLSLYYQHELNMKEIAVVMQRTEARVCQLHKQAISRLQAVLQNEMESY
ncbi:FliA/WhiG family RNA polymerase sigma factor [Citrobacter sp. R56]|uniref:FliA/WhiG family RNA polymerase sigma factor n=1 Tax=Citrobacter sp. R56 TaxID=1573676 RepID=UPI00107A40A3|nr:FliA/WhiG family RNA polymerase sigma factor [Citrobacter sp. R56]QRG78262.1 FliA/WhiG family RNA polymerase sigma factor [Citrobacter sp. R56]